MNIYKVAVRESMVNYIPYDEYDKFKENKAIKNLNKTTEKLFLDKISAEKYRDKIILHLSTIHEDSSNNKDIISKLTSINSNCIYASTQYWCCNSKSWSIWRHTFIPRA